MVDVEHTLKQETLRAAFWAVQLLPDVWDSKVTRDSEQCYNNKHESGTEEKYFAEP